MGDQSNLKLQSILIMKAFIFATLLALATSSPLKLKEDTPEATAVAPVVYIAHAPVAPVVHHVPHVAPVVHIAHAPVLTHYAYAAPFPVFIHKLAEEALPVAPTAPVAPVEDTPEVAAAKVSFKAAFDAAAAGEHSALASKPLPVPTPVVPVQGPAVYLADAPEVAEAKVSFKAAFDAAEAGEHAALTPKQGPAVYLADTPEVVEAKATFKAAFDAATAGEDTVSAQTNLLEYIL